MKKSKSQNAKLELLLILNIKNLLKYYTEKKLCIVNFLTFSFKKEFHSDIFENIKLK